MSVLLSFGLNEDGQCGVKKCGNSVGMSVVKFPESVIIVSVSAGSRHSLALASNGRVYSWGWGLLGQLGLGTFASIDSPSLVESLSQITCKAVSAGGTHSAAIDSCGNIYTWGSHSYGQLGIGTFFGDDDHRKIPTLMCVEEDNSKHDSMIETKQVIFEKISCGGMHTVALDSYGNVYCWGRADSGQTGYSDYNQSIGLFRPIKLQGVNEPASDIATGGFHTIILTISGKVFSMGKDDFGLLGIPRTKCTNLTTGTAMPTQIEFFSRKGITIKKIAAGGWHSCFVSTEGELYTCGKGEYGRLGTGSGASVDEPMQIQTTEESEGAKSNDSCVQSISAGGSHTLWIAGGRAYVVGRTDDNRLGLVVSQKEVKTGVTRARLIDIPAPLIPPSFSLVSVVCGGSNSFILAHSPPN